MKIHLKTAEEVSKFWHGKMFGKLKKCSAACRAMICDNFVIKIIEFSEKTVVVRDKSLVRMACTWQILEVTRL